MLVTRIKPVPVLPSEILPAGFRYPPAYLAFVQGSEWADLLNHKPWSPFGAADDGVALKSEVARVASQCPSLKPVPFAYRSNGNVAFFDGECRDGSPRIAFIYLESYDTGCELNPETRLDGWLENFEAWLRVARFDSSQRASEDEPHA